MHILIRAKASYIRSEYALDGVKHEKDRKWRFDGRKILYSEEKENVMERNRFKQS